MYLKAKLVITNIIIRISILIIAIPTIGCKTWQLRGEGVKPSFPYEKRQQNKYYWRRRSNPNDWNNQKYFP